jgi:phage-related minor tail protein
MTKLMAQFNIDAKEGAATMDLLFGSAQQSGMGFDELTASLQKFAPVGQAFGLGMEDQIEQIIMFKEAGVDAQTMTVALRTAQQALAKDGIEPTAEALGDIFFKIVEAETETEKLSIATEYFGTKAAPTMLTALENSNSLMDTMAYGLDETTGALEATTTATEGWEETWTSAMNNMKLALIPLGDTFKNFLDENAEGFTEWITNSLVPGINTAVSKINELINTMSDGQGLLDLGGGEGSVFNQQHGQSNLTQGIIDYMKGSDYWTTYNPGIIEMLERGKQNQLSLETGNQYGGPEAIVNPYNIINVYGDVNDPQMFEQMTRGQGVR